MSYRRLGDKPSADALLSQIDEEMELIESVFYHNRLLMYKGLRTAESLLEAEEDDAESRALVLATQGYGVGNWYLYNGDVDKAKSVFKQVLRGKSWSAFGYIAAEVEMLHL